MKKRIRILSLACAAAMTICMFSGCGSSTSTADSTAEAVSPTAAQTSGAAAASGYKQASAADAPTIVWWQIGTQPQNLADGVAKINEYTAEKYGVKIDIKVAGWGDYDTKMNTIVNTGEAFDIMFVNNNNYNRFVNLGAMADITELVQKEAPELFKFIPETVWSGTKIADKIYAVPTYKDSSITQYFVWDDAIVQKYKIDIANLKTMQDLDAVFHTIKAGQGKAYYPCSVVKEEGFNGTFNDYDDLTLGLKPIGVRITDGSRKVVSVLEQPDIMDKLKLMHKWYKDGIINADAATLGESAKGRMFFSAQAFPGAEADFQVKEGVAKYDMVQQFGPIFSTSSIQGSMNSVSANSKYKTEALKFLQAVNTDTKLRNLLAYGIEGVNWETVTAGTDSKVPVIKKLNDVWSLPAYSQGTFFNMGVQSPNTPDQWSGVKKLNEQATSSSVLGFALDITKLQTEAANCKAVYEKYKCELLTGTSDPEVIVPKMVKELKASGMDTIMTEAQKQIDGYFK